MVLGFINFRGMLFCGFIWFGVFFGGLGKRFVKERGIVSGVVGRVFERGLGYLVSIFV